MCNNKKQMMGQASENMILSTRKWIAAGYLNFELLKDLRLKIRRYNKLLNDRINND